MNNLSLQNVESAMLEVLAGRYAREESKELPESVRAIQNLERLAIYMNDISKRRLWIAKGAFPMICKLLGKRDWQNVVNEYWYRYPSTHKFPTDSLAQFAQFLRDENPDTLNKYPFIADLADFEYAQLKIKNAQFSWNEQLLPINLNRAADRRELAPVVNPSLTVKTYNHPIMEISELVAETKRRRFQYQDYTCRIAIYQNPASKLLEVRQIGAIAAMLIEWATEDPSLTLAALVQKVASEYPEMEKKEVRRKTLQLMKQLIADGIFCGATVSTNYLFLAGRRLGSV